MTNRNSVIEGDVHLFYERRRRATAPEALDLPHVIVAPLYQVERASDTSGVLSETARLDWENDGDSQYSGDVFTPSEIYSPLPNLLPGAVVDPSKTDLYMRFGTGGGAPVTRLWSENDEEVMVDRSALSSSGVLGALNGTGDARLFTDAGVNFDVVFGGHEEPPTLMALVAQNYFLVLTGHEDKPIPIISWGTASGGPDDKTQLLVAPLSSSILASTTYGYRIVRLKRNYQVYPSGRKARVGVSDFALAAGSVLESPGLPSLDGGGTFRVTNVEPGRTWTFNITDPAPAVSADLRVEISDVVGVAPRIVVHLGTDAGGVLDATKNTFEAIQAEWESAFTRSRHYWPGWMPVQLELVTGAATETLSNGLGDNTIDPPAQSWTGRLESTSVGALSTQVDFMVSTEIDADMSVIYSEQTDALTVVFGTDGGGAFDSAKNTVVILNALFLLAGAPFIVQVDGTAAGTEVVTPTCLASFRLPWGATWREDYRVLTALQMHGGLDAGGVAIHGALLANTESSMTVRAPVFAEYRALRRDVSAMASLDLTGTRPDPLQVRQDEVSSLLGEVSEDNPGALAMEIFQLSSNGRTAYFLGVDEVSDDSPWGTEAALDRARDLLMKRDPYHVIVMNDAGFVVPWAYSHVVALGGTQTERLRKAQMLYVPTKNLSSSADDAVVSGSDADRVPSTPTTLVGDVNFSDAGVRKDDVIVFVGLETSTASGSVALQNGQRGFPVFANPSSGDPFKLQFLLDLPATVSNKAFTVWRPGSSLTGSSGIYDSAAAAAALWHYHSSYAHRRLIKHHVDRIEANLGTAVLDLDGVYGLANFAGIVARHASHMPVSTLQYTGLQRVSGTDDTFEPTELNTLQGAGLVLPKNEGRSAVQVRRDLSSDTSTFDTTRRTATVTEDILNIRTARVVRAILGPDLVDVDLLDSVAMELTAIENDFREGKLVQSIEFMDIRPIDDDIRAEFGIDDTGVFATFMLQHLKEASSGIINVIVTP